MLPSMSRGHKSDSSPQSTPYITVTLEAGSVPTPLGIGRVYRSPCLQNAGPFP